MVYYPELINENADLVHGVCCVLEHASLNCVLIVHGPKGISLPGGKREGNETVFETGARELFEETGLRIPSEDKVDFIEPRVDDSGRRTYCLKVKDWTGRLEPSSEGMPYWADPWVLLSPMARFPDYNRWVMDLLKISYRRNLA